MHAFASAGSGSTHELERAVLAGIPLTAHVALAVDASARWSRRLCVDRAPAHRRSVVGNCAISHYLLRADCIDQTAGGFALTVRHRIRSRCGQSRRRMAIGREAAGRGQTVRYSCGSRLRAPACTYGLMRLHAVAHRCCWKLIRGHDQQHGAARWVGCAHAGNVAHGPRQSATGGTGRCERQRSTLQRPELPPVSAAATRLDGTAGAWCCARAQGPGAAEPRWNASSSCPAVSATEGCVELRRCRAELTFAVAAAATVGLRMCQGCGPRALACFTVASDQLAAGFP